jgi:hypothetical protein
MRLWNGWGDAKILYPLPTIASTYLAAVVGKGAPIPDASFEQTLAGVPPARRLPPHSLISSEAEERLRHVCGQKPAGLGCSALRADRQLSRWSGISHLRRSGAFIDRLRTGNREVYVRSIYMIPVEEKI